MWRPFGSQQFYSYHSFRLCTRSSSSHVFTIPESTNFFHEIFFVFFFYQVEVFYRDQKCRCNLIITEKDKNRDFFFFGLFIFMICEKHVMKSLLDGSDCVMLSGETAKGDYPVQCIKTMSALTQEAEACLWNERFFEEQLKQVSWTRRVWGHSELILRYSFGISSEKNRPYFVIIMFPRY